MSQIYHSLSESDCSYSEEIQDTPMEVPLDTSIIVSLDSSPMEVPLDASPIRLPLDTSPTQVQFDTSFIKMPLETSPKRVILDISPSKEPCSSNYSAISKTENNASKRRAKKGAFSEIAKLKKLEKAAEKDIMERILPTTCLKYVSVCISKNILCHSKFSELSNKSCLCSLNVNVVEDEEDLIFWTRNMASGENIIEPHLLLIWDHVKLLSHIENCTFNKFFSDLQAKKPKFRIYLAIYGLKIFCKRLRKNNKLSDAEKHLKMRPTKDSVENILCELQLISGIQSKLIDDINELAVYISQATKSVGEEPYKKKKAEIEVEKNLYLQEDSRSCVKIDKQNNGMKRLWVQQLAQLPKSSLDCAKAISLVYPSPHSLYSAYVTLADKTERENLLQDITIGRESSTKRIGPELSKKISYLFSSNGDISNRCNFEMN